MLKKISLIFLVIIPLIIFAKNPVQITFSYDNGIPNKIMVNGEVVETQWLGVSLYPLKYKDAIKEGYHIVREITKGSYQEEVIFDSNMTKNFNDSYEVALWGKKVFKKDCTIKDCYWCKTNGFHLDDLRFYTSGYFNTLDKK